MTIAAVEKTVLGPITDIPLGEGRTYAGGLTKFEPREMERLRVPLALLEHGGAISRAP
jgi:hypothetical protein